MKKLTAAIAALALYFSASALGPEPTNDLNALLNPSNAKVIKSAKVGRSITTAFTERFSNATEVNWKEHKGLYFGYFKQLGEAYTVAYTPEADLFAVARPVKLTDLPEAVSKKLAEKYKDCTVASNATEIIIEGETGYYVTVENKLSSRLLKFYADGQDEVINKTKKKVLVGSVM